MFRKIVLSVLALMVFSCGLIAYAGEKKAIEIDVPYVEGKVNDPVSKSARTAYIVTENPTLSFSLENGKKVEVMSYCNEYLEGEDRGIRNRLMGKTLLDGEKFTLLPEEEYESAKNNGSLYNTADRCYVLRIYNEGTENYDEIYFGIVEEDIFKDFQEKAKEGETLLQKRIRELGPAAARKN